MGRKTLRVLPEQVALLAYRTVYEVMTEGSPKEGSNDTWLDKPKNFHRDKSIRHLISCDLDKDDDHSRNAVVRAVMHFYQNEYNAYHECAARNASHEEKEV